MEEERRTLDILDGKEFSEEEDFLSKYKWKDVDIEGDMLDQTEEYTPPRYTLSWDGVKFAPVGGLHVITGQSGHGKTFTFTQMIVAILRGSFGDLKYELKDVEKPTVLYVDTEQEKENTKLVNLRVYEMLGWTFRMPHPEFRIMCLRETETALERWQKILKAIYTFKPTVCFIDGLLDIVADFNDNAECQEMVYANMKLASHYGMSLWVLVHENPNTTKMVGHLGSILQRKVTDELGTVKIKDEDTGLATFTVKQKKARGKDLKKWTFHVVDGAHNFGIPEISDGHLTDEVIAKRLKSIMPLDGYGTTDLRGKIAGAFGVSVIDARTMMDEFAEKGILKSEKTGKSNSVVWSLNKDIELPF